MKVTSAKFVKSILGTDYLLENGIPQIAFIGRSNVGKSSVINSLVNQKNLAKTSSFPGRTQMINLFLINKSFYLVDLPGYGFAKIPKDKREQIEGMLNWYFFDSNIEQKKVVLIIDAEIGPTKEDRNILFSLEEYKKDIIIVANKIDKIKKSEYVKQIAKIQALVGEHKVIPYSAEKKIGINDLLEEIK